MLYQSRFPGDLFAELDRIQREMQQAFSNDPSIRGVGRGGFPAMNVGSTPESVELYAFAPGLETESIEVHLERGVLTVSGERPDQTIRRRAAAFPDDPRPDRARRLRPPGRCARS